MHKYLLLLSLIIGSCKGPSDKPAVTKSENEKQPSSKTSAHIQVPGSQLYLIPPPGFANNSTSGQIEKEDATIMMMKFVAGNTPETFLAELKVQSEKDYPGYWKEESINAGGHPAKIYQYKSFGLSQHYLFFTDGSTDEILVARFEENDDQTAEALYQSLKTTVLDN